MRIGIKYLAFYLFLFVFLLPASCLSAQVEPDSADIAYYSKKNGLIASSEIIAINAGVWSAGRYIRKAPFAYIDIHSVKHNFQKGFYWDFDGLDVNMLAHPYHGSAYFDAARSNGYNFWQSGLFALGGSVMWEMFMESETPSINDICTTPVGGVAIGEMLYRMSDLILDDRTKGNDRFSRELLSFMVSPSRGLTRLITGDAWKRRATSGKQFGIPDYQLEIASGIRFTDFKDLPGKKTDFIIEANAEYGDRFDDECSHPFDYFQVNVEASTAIYSIVSRTSLTGRYACAGLVDTKNASLNLGIYQYIDYYNRDEVDGAIPYRFGAPVSGGLGLYYQTKQLPNCQLDADAHLKAVAMGAVYTDHFTKHKDYNIGSGFGWQEGVRFSLANRFSLSASHEGYRLFTWQGYPPDATEEQISSKLYNVQGNQSQATFQVFDLTAGARLSKHIYLSGEYRSFSRKTNYKDYPSVFSQTAETSLSLGYRF
jgi:hypothetical protein